MRSPQPSPELTQVLEQERPGAALDLACGSGRHALWLAAHGWHVTAVDIIPAELPDVEFVQADLESEAFPVKAAGWDLILCWLYWQPDLLPSIAAGVRPGGIAALAGKTTGRFATSLESYRNAFAGWQELAAGEHDGRAFFIARRSG